MRSAGRTFWWMFPALAALVLAGSGCAKSVGALDARNERDPLMERASERERSNDFGAAIERYQEALGRDPDLVKAHLKLGLLYDDHENDYLRAIYHYERYLEMRPQSEKREEIEELARLARLNSATAIPEKASHAIRLLARMQQQVVQMEEDMAASERRILSLEVENRKLTGALGTARKKIVTSSGQNSDGDVARVPAAVVPGGSKKYVVRNGDNLYDIARKFYHDGTKWRMILRANESTLRSSEKNVKPGQTLVIPALPQDGG